MIYLDDDIVEELAFAIVDRAVKDWRSLCKGRKQSGDCNFKELERFFKKDCAKFIQSQETAEKIWEQLKLERRRAMR